MFNFTVTGVFPFKRFVRIYFKCVVFNRILDFGEHVVTVAVDYLYELAYLAPGVGHVLLFASQLAFIVIVNCERFRKYRY